MHSKVAAAVWRVADPKITLASMSSLAVGLALAWRDGEWSPGWALVTVLGVFAVEAAKNASGDIFDFDSGTDQAVTDSERSPFSGGKRILVDGLVTRAGAWGIALLFYVVGALAGLGIMGWREPRVLWLGLVGFALAYFYHAPPLRLSYRGMGELAVGLAYGPLISSGAYLVQRGRMSVELLMLSLPLAVLVAAFLWINEFPDARADALAGKRTWVVRLGRERATGVFAMLLIAAFALLVVAVGSGASAWALFGLAGVPWAWRAVGTLRRAGSVAEMVPAQAATLLTFVLYAAGVVLGVVIDVVRPR